MLMRGFFWAGLLLSIGLNRLKPSYCLSAAVLGSSVLMTL